MPYAQEFSAEQAAAAREQARQRLVRELRELLGYLESDDPTERRRLAQHVDGYWHRLVVGSSDDIAEVLSEEPVAVDWPKGEEPDEAHDLHERREEPEQEAVFIAPADFHAGYCGRCGASPPCRMVDSPCPAKDNAGGT